MVFVSLTRLRIRSIRFVPLFAFHTFRSLRQVSKSPGFQSGSLLADRSWTFWTLTAMGHAGEHAGLHGLGFAQAGDAASAALV